MSVLQPPSQDAAAALLPGVPMTAAAPTFEEYTQGIDLFQHLDNIDSFNMSVKLSDIGTWPATATPHRLAYRIYDYLETVLREVDLFETNTLTTEATEREVTVSYGDPEYEFTLTLDSKGTFNLRRRGSSLPRFHDWYWKIVPSISQLLNVITSFLSDEFKREAGFERRFYKQSALYQFQFVARDFKYKDHRRSLPAAKNTEVVRGILPLVPGRNGGLTDELSPSLSLGRAEYVAHRTIDPDAGDYRREVYRIAAPSNWDWTSLWFTFSLVGDIYTDPDGRRYPFEERALIGSDGLKAAYVDFLRERALAGFMSSIIGQYDFETVVFN